MKQDFFAGWRAYMAGDALDLNWDYDRKSGWRAAEIKYRGTAQAKPPKPEIPRRKEG